MTGALVVLGGYLLGSMPFGYWLVLLLKGEDIRTVGSGNIGASNVWRTYGKALRDPDRRCSTSPRGSCPRSSARSSSVELVGVLAGGAAMLGHWRPLFLRFQKGGKTVATGGGTFLGVVPLLGLIGVAIWLVVFLVFRYASLASMVTGVALPFVALALGEPWPVIVFAAIASVAVLVLHKANIARLRAGTESRFHFRRGPKPA